MALTATSGRWSRGRGNKRARIVKNRVQVYKLGFVVLDAATGHLIPLTTDTANRFAGVASNDLFGDGASTIGVYGAFEGEFTKSGTLLQANVGEPVCGIDDDTVAPALAVYTSGTGVANAAFTITSKIPGLRFNVHLNVEKASDALQIRAVGADLAYTIYIRAKSTAGSAQDSLASEIKTALEADTLLNSLFTFAYQGGHDGSGKPAAFVAAPATLPGPIVGRLTSIRGSKVGVCIDGYAN